MGIKHIIWAGLFSTTLFAQNVIDTLTSKNYELMKTGTTVVEY